MTPQEIMDEVNAHGFEDTDILRKEAALNFAIRNFAQRKPWPFLEKVVTLTFNGTSAAPTDTPSDLRAVMKLIDYTNGMTRIQFMRTDDAEEQYDLSDTSSGEPLFYYFEGTTLKAYKVPTARTMRLRYLRTAPSVTSSDPESAIIVPRDGHEALVFRTLMRLYDLEDDPELSARFEAHYENEVAQITDALITLQHDEPEYIHVIDADEWDYS